MLGSTLRTTLLRASESSALRRQVESRRLSRQLAMRFVAGERLEDGLRVTKSILKTGKTVTLDYLGEYVTSPDEAQSAQKIVLTTLDRIGAERLDCGMSVKPTQFGLGLSEDRCFELLDEIAARAGSVGAQLTLDMEASDVTEATVRLVKRLKAAGHDDVGCAVQSYLHRTRDDVERLSAVGASLRLCKGAYAEPPRVAYSDRREIDENFAVCASYLLAHGTFPRVATHDHRLLERVKREAWRLGVGKDAFEFQMLYGVRTSLQDELVREGYRLRVYVPFGDQWYPYFMRRLAERPANLAFFLRSLRDT